MPIPVDRGRFPVLDTLRGLESTGSRRFSDPASRIAVAYLTEVKAEGAAARLETKNIRAKLDTKIEELGRASVRIGVLEEQVRLGTKFKRIEKIVVLFGGVLLTASKLINDQMPNSFAATVVFGAGVVFAIAGMVGVPTGEKK